MADDPGARFCSVFDFDGKSLISRMFIYIGADYTGLDTDRFRWKRIVAQWRRSPPDFRSDAQFGWKGERNLYQVAEVKGVPLG